MKINDFVKYLNENDIYLHSFQSYVELHNAVYDASTATKHEDIVGQMNDLILHYYPKSSNNVMLLRGISKNGSNEVPLHNDKVKTKKDFFKFVVYPCGKHERIDLTKNKSYQTIYEAGIADILKYYTNADSEYFDKKKIKIIFSVHLRDYKFPLKIHENKKKIFDKVFNIKNGLSDKDKNELENLVKTLLIKTIKPHHQDKLKDYVRPI